MPLRRYKCPECGSALSRTVVHPEWLSLKAEAPEFRMPLLPIVSAIMAVGVGLAIVHPALSILAVLGTVFWLYWRYFSYLQCDSCSRFYFGGQLSGHPRATVPWTRSELKKRAVAIGVAGGMFGLLFTPLYLMEQKAKSRCSTECALAGSQSAYQQFKCKCLPILSSQPR